MSSFGFINHLHGGEFNLFAIDKFYDFINHLHGGESNLAVEYSRKLFINHLHGGEYYCEWHKKES